MNADFLLSARGLAMIVLDELVELGDPLGVGRRALLMTVGFALEFVVAVDGFADGAFDFRERTAEIGDLLFLLGDLGGECLGLVDEVGDLGFEARNVGLQQVVLVPRETRVDSLELVEKFLIIWSI